MQHVTTAATASMLRKIALAALVLQLVSCSSAVVLEDPFAEVHNRSPRHVQTVMYRACGEGEGSWRPMTQFGGLAAYNSARLPIPLDCVDLAALSADSKVLGTQYGIRSKFPFRWVLQ